MGWFSTLIAVLVGIVLLGFLVSAVLIIAGILAAALAAFTLLYWLALAVEFTREHAPTRR